MFDQYCSRKQQETILDSLKEGDQLMAQSLYSDCERRIRNDNPDTKAAKKLDTQFRYEGITAEQIVEMRDLQERGQHLGSQLTLELLHTLKTKEDPTGICTIDFDKNGDPSKPDTIITCKK